MAKENNSDSNERNWQADGGRVFTTGAFVEAQEISGEWRWIVTGFEDDTFYDGNTLDVNETAATQAGLVNPDDADDGADDGANEAADNDFLDFLADDGDYINIVPED